MKGKLAGIISAGLALVLLMFLPGCEGKKVLTIFHAGSLAVPFKEMEKEFEEMHPDVDVQREAAGSARTIRKVTELGRKADIVGSSDYSIILPMMSPKYADWCISFARNRMVLTYTGKSAYSDKINKENWYNLLTNDPENKGVSYGHGNPDVDPCGYRALMVWELAEKYYDVPGLYDSLLVGSGRESKGREVVRPKETDLIALLEAGELDYAFEYLSLAKQHGLRFVQLPTKIDLSSTKFEDFYAQATVDIAGKEPGTTITKEGKPIVYGLTIPKNAENPELAIAFMKYLLGEKGQDAMNRNGQPSIMPAVLGGKAKTFPVELKSFIKKANQQPEED